MIVTFPIYSRLGNREKTATHRDTKGNLAVSAHPIWNYYCYKNELSVKGNYDIGSYCIDHITRITLRMKRFLQQIVLGKL